MNMNMNKAIMGNAKNKEDFVMLDNEEFSIIDFMKNNVLQILLFILVFIIIYVVDYISHLNSLIFVMPSAIPGMPSTGVQIEGKITKNGKNNKKSKK
jgi:hypothetical protein